MVTKKVAIEKLGDVPLFATASQKDLASIFDLARVVQYGDGVSLVSEGETGFGFHLILEGEVKVVRKGRTVATLGSGDFFGEMSLIDDQPRSASIVATGSVESLVLGGWEFKPMLKKNPTLAWKLLVHLTGRLRDEQSARDAATS